MLPNKQTWVISWGGWRSWGGRSGDNERLLFFFRSPNFIASLWMGLDRWLFGGLIFEGPPSMRRNFAFFFRFVYFSLLTPRACCQIKVHLCYVYSQLIPLHALGKVWLPDSILQQCEILAVHFSPNLRHQECWCTHLPGPREHSTWKAVIDWFKRVWACSPYCTQTNRNGYLCPACFWWIQECFLCPSCPTLIWKRWFDGFNNVAGG